MIKYTTVHVPFMKYSIDDQGKNSCSVSSGVEWIGYDRRCRIGVFHQDIPLFSLFLS